MYQESAAVFYYCLTPVRMGAGTAVGGLIDNPIQREAHTGHALFAGSGIKGAVRHFCNQDGWPDWQLAVVFGPGSANASDHAGAVSFTDAQLVAMPVRALKSSFVYATCPTALARAKRLLDSAGVKTLWNVPTVDDGHALHNHAGLLGGVRGQELVLEVYAYTARQDEQVSVIGKWLGAHALPDGSAHEYFRKKLETDLVVLTDEAFGFFAEHATSVEPHVRIDDTTGTADDGGLFYTENLPPESILLGLVMASVERTTDELRKKMKSRNGHPVWEAPQVVAALRERLHQQRLQIGGDSTTGRGQVLLSFVASAGGDGDA